MSARCDPEPWHRLGRWDFSARGIARLMLRLLDLLSAANPVDNLAEIMSAKGGGDCRDAVYLYDLATQMNPTTVSLGPDQIRAMFTRRVKAFARRDARDASADYAADCVRRDLTSGTVTGRAAVEGIRAWFAAPTAPFKRKESR